CFPFTLSRFPINLECFTSSEYKPRTLKTLKFSPVYSANSSYFFLIRFVCSNKLETEFNCFVISLILIIQIYSKHPHRNMCTGFCISQSVVMIFECKSQILRNGMQLMIRKFRKKLLCFSVGTKKWILMYRKSVSCQNSF